MGIVQISGYYAGDTYLDFLELGGTSGISEQFLPNAINSSSSAVTIPGGFSLGITSQTHVYVSGILFYNTTGHLTVCIM